MRRKKRWESVRPTSLRQLGDMASQKPATTMAVVDIGPDFSSIWNPRAGTLCEPSTVAVDSSGTARSFGLEAILVQARRGKQLMIEKPFAASRHLDPTMAEAYLIWLFAKAGFMGVDAVPVFLPMHAASPPETLLSQFVSDLGGNPIVIHRPVAAAIGLDVVADRASSHLMVELWEEGTEVAIIKGGAVVLSEMVHSRSGELAVAAIDRLLYGIDPDAELEIRGLGMHVYGWAAQHDALGLASVTTMPLATPLGSGSTVLCGARLLAESVLPWLAGPPRES